MLKYCIFSFFLFCTFHLYGESAHYLFIKGYIGHELVATLQDELDAAKETKGGRVLIQVDSSSGDLQEALYLAHQIYDLKTHQDKSVVVYIQGKAVGPAAIFPFLADELVTTPLVAWGDIPYGTENRMERGLLQNSVKGLISQESSRAATLEQLVHAMVDPHYKVIYEGGHTTIQQDSYRNFDPLILNLKGLQSLGLVDQVCTTQEFHFYYLRDQHLSEKASQKISTNEVHQKFEHYISFSETEDNLIGYIHIGNDRPINQSTYIYIKFALEDFIKKNVRLVVLDLNTPGGEVLAALKIVDLLQKLDIQHHIPVIAFLDDWAVSAGAMLAYSCRFIGIGPHSIMGAAEPVIAEAEGSMVSASEKVNSTLRAEFANLSSFYGRDSMIAEAMVDKDIILVMRNHRITQLNSEEEIHQGGSNPDLILSGKGKLLTLNAKQLIDYGVADFEVAPVPLPEINDEERSKGTWPACKSLVFQEPYLSHIPHAVMVDYQDWRVSFFSLLSHPVIASLLFMGLIIGLYIEINTPGFGFPGSIGIACLVLILLSSFSSHTAHWIEVILLCIGLALLALELFVIPGFGITGILGIVLTIIGLFALMIPGIGKLNILDPGTFQLVGIAFIQRLAWLSAALILSVVIIIFLAKFFSHRYFRFSKLILKGEQEAKKGYLSGISSEMMPDEGEKGETVSPLRPSGKVHIGDNLFDATTRGEYIKSNVVVEIIKIEGSKVVVQPFKKEKK